MELAGKRIAVLGAGGSGFAAAELALSRGASVDAEVVRYPGARHGFHCDARGDYHERAATDAWTRTLAWFGTHLA